MAKTGKKLFTHHSLFVTPVRWVRHCADKQQPVADQGGLKRDTVTKLLVGHHDDEVGGGSGVVAARLEEQRMVETLYPLFANW
jgi:hypothetical protein